MEWVCTWVRNNYLGRVIRGNDDAMLVGGCYRDPLVARPNKFGPISELSEGGFLLGPKLAARLMGKRDASLGTHDLRYLGFLSLRKLTEFSSKVDSFFFLKVGRFIWREKASKYG